MSHKRPAYCTAHQKSKTNDWKKNNYVGIGTKVKINHCPPDHTYPKMLNNLHRKCP